MHQYLVGTLILLVPWTAFYAYREDLRRKIIFSSLLCLPTGVLELLYVPGYWNPQPLLAFSAMGLHFDIESFIYAFAIGGVAAGAYETLMGKHLEPVQEIKDESHSMVLVGLIVSTVAIFSTVFDSFMFPTLAGLAVGSLSIVTMRHDLLEESILGGALFLAIHSMTILLLDPLLFQGWVTKTWTVSGFLGRELFTLPYGDMLFSFLFGTFWTPLYEDLKGYRVKEDG
ncbi:MAG: lycopene cyclase domain-containing protein [Candidatus Nanohaloarchaea archaeon]